MFYSGHSSLQYLHCSSKRNVLTSARIMDWIAKTLKQQMTKI